MIYDRMNSILEQSSIDEMDSLFESIMHDLENIDIDIPLQKGITESMLNRHNIMKGSIMYPLFEQEDFDTSNAQDVEYRDTDDNSNKNNNSEPEINTEKDSFFKKFSNSLKLILDKFIKLIKKAVMFFSEKIFNNDKFLKEHQKELEEVLRKTPTIEGKIPSISIKSIENGEDSYFTEIASRNLTKYAIKMNMKYLQEGKKIGTFEFVCKQYSFGRGEDLYSVLQVVREKFLEPNRGKKGTIKLEESKEIIDKYGRDYVKFLKEQIGEIKKQRANVDSDVSSIARLNKEGHQIAVAIARCSYTISINIHKEVITIMRQGIGEHERILKSAILKNSNSKSEK